MAQAQHFSRRSWALGVPSQLYGTVPVEGGWLWWECVSAFPVFIIIFSQLSYACSHSSSFWISLKRNYYICGWILGSSIGGGKFRRLQCHYLGLELRMFSLSVFFCLYCNYSDFIWFEIWSPFSVSHIYLSLFLISPPCSSSKDGDASPVSTPFPDLFYCNINSAPYCPQNWLFKFRSSHFTFFGILPCYLFYCLLHFTLLILFVNFSSLKFSVPHQKCKPSGRY